MQLSNEKIVYSYNIQKMSCSEIARKDGRSESTIYNILKDNGVRMRDRSEANQLFADDILIKLYNMGLSYSQIGELLGIHPSTVTKRFKTIGFPSRGKRLAAAIRYTNEEFRKHFCAQNF